MRPSSGRSPRRPRPVSSTAPGEAVESSRPAFRKATDAAVTRFRTGHEGSRAYNLGARLSLKPERRGVAAQRRNSPMLGGASNGMLGRATLGW